MTRKLLALLLFCFVTYTSGSQTFHNEWIDYNKTYYKFKVAGFGLDAVNAPITKGIVRIPFSTISSMGLNTTPAENFQLWRDGEEVPLYVSKATGILGSADYIEFWGEINNGKLDKELYRDPEFQLSDRWSLQTDTAAYFLTVNTAGTNKRLQPTANNVAGNTLSPTTYFMHTVGRHFRAELSNGFSAVVGQNLYSSSYDRGEGFVSRRIRGAGSNCSANPLPQNFGSLYAFTGPSAPQMKFNINAVGNNANSRTVRVTLNNTQVSHFQMDYFFDAKIEEYIPVSLIQNDAANFVLSNTSTAPCDEFRTSMIELTYPRTFNFGGASVFEFKLDPSANGRFLEISNFNNSGIAPILYDIENGKRYEGDISTAGKIKVLLQPSTKPYNLVLTTQAGAYYKTITALQQRNFVNYGLAANQGDYLIITNPLLFGNSSSNYVQQYKDYRQSAKGGSYKAQIVDIDQLVDQFAWGIKKHPLSIKNFLKYARNSFAVAPKSAFLIGKGVSYNDYRSNENNSLIEQSNLIPTWGYPASDNLLSSETNEVAIPATPIGRLSAVSAQEVGDYLEKVKQYEAAQQSTDQSLKAKDWMKNVLQIAGANDIALGKQLEGFMAEYETIIEDTAFGARAITYSKTANPTGYNDALISFKNNYEEGASLITYFGHSSATSLDFNLDDPQTYNNKDKYPVFIANGCSAGNHFAFETNRFNNKSTISERFVLAPQRGAIGYLASTHFGVVGYLDTYTKEFYKAFGKTKYNQPIGEAIKEGITTALDSYPQADYYARVHAEEYAFHGDPAIKINAFALPDYVVEEPQITITPAFVSVADTGFTAKIKVNNIGRATGDSVTFRLNRTFPNGSTVTVLTRRFSKLLLEDSVSVYIPIISNRDKGINVLTATLDYNNELSEIVKYNNTARKNIEISEDEIRPIYPYRFAVINQPVVKLAASTVNPFSASRTYLMEIDTTELFNSPLKVNKSTVSSGGVIEFDAGFSFVENRTYYWRVAPSGSATPHWNISSFVYRSGSTHAVEQGHMYQNLNSLLTGLTFNNATNKYNFLKKSHNLFITNSVYPTSGTEDSHFSVSVDGNTSIQSACLGSSIIINVFDSLTFEPWKNTTNPFGAAPTCHTLRQHNFEYSYRTADTRRNAASFLNSIPDGAFVAVRLVLDAPYNVFAADWAKDSAAYGNNNSLYHKLKTSGFADIDSFDRARTWAFVFKKGDANFTPVSKFSQDLYDRVTLSVDAITPGTIGTVVSPKFGPAKSWSKVVWNGYSEEVGTDVPTVDVIGIKADNVETVLFTLDNATHEFNISSVNAAQYPFIKLRLNNKDTAKATPYQLTSWRVDYDAVPEGGLAPNLHFKMPDNHNGVVGSPDTLRFSVGFKNVSKVNFDPLNVKLVLTDTTTGLSRTYVLPQTRALPAGDTLHIPVNINAADLSGTYNVYLQVNPNNLATEQHSFNNFFYRLVNINNARLLPVTLLDFNALLQGADVRTTWSITEEINVKEYVVEHSTNGTSFKAVGALNATNGQGVINYTFVHPNAPEGKNFYRLVIVDKDGSSKISPVRLITIGKSLIVNVYPNPVKDKVTVSLNRSISKPAGLKLINAFGQVLYQQQLSGTVQIDMTRFAAGMYVIQVDDGEEVSTFKVQKQ